MGFNPPLEPRDGWMALEPSEVKEGDVIFSTYHSSVMPGPARISRKYLVLSVDKTSRPAIKLKCVVLYAYRYMTPGRVLDLDLSRLPVKEQWGVEV